MTRGIWRWDEAANGGEGGLVPLETGERSAASKAADLEKAVEWALLQAKIPPTTVASPPRPR